MLWTVNELAEYLQIKPSTLYAWAAQGKIRCLKINGLLRFHADEITQWIESFRRPSPFRIPPHVRSNSSGPDLDTLIARAKRAVYTPANGRPDQDRAKAKEVDDGSV
jgi:excisionase family DNA binding protein